MNQTKIGKNSYRIFIILIFSIAESLIFCSIRNSQIVGMYNIEKTIYGYEITGEDSYVELTLNKPIAISNLRIVVKGYNYPYTECVVNWKGVGDTDYTDEKSSWEYVECWGEPVSFQIDSSDIITDLRIRTGLKAGYSIRSIYVTKMSKITEGLCDVLLLFNPIFCFLIILILSAKLRDGFSDAVNRVSEIIKSHMSLKAFMIVLLFIIGILYIRYLTSERLYIFNDIGADSIAWHYPNHIDWVRRLVEYGWGDGWNPRVGLGMSQDSFFPSLENWFYIFGEDKLPYCLALNQCLKMWLAGIFCYLYVSTFTKNEIFRWILGIGYAFCPFLVMYGAWELMGSTAVMVMLWMWLYELFRTKRKYVLLIIGTVLFFATAHIYEVVLYLGIFSVYIAFRCISEYKDSKDRREFFDIVVFLLFALLSSGNTLYSKFVDSILSDRFTQEVHMGLFNDPHIYLVAFSRTVGMDIMGITSKFTSHAGADFLEAPAFYCGILTLMLVPVSVFCLKGTKRILTIIAYIIVLLYMLIIPFRYLMNGMSGFTWRLSSLWIILLMIYTVACGADKYFLLNNSKKLKNVVFTTLVICIILLLVILIKQEVVFANSLFVSALFIITYAILLIFGHDKAFNNCTIGILALLLTCIEAYTLSYGVVNNRRTLESNFRYNRTYYYDSVVEILDNIKDEQLRDSFRIVNGILDYQCSSLGQSYMSIPSYVGQTGIGSSVMSIVRQFRIPHDESGRIIFGTDIYNEFLTLIGNRYIISRDDSIPNFGYKKIDESNGIYIYENQYNVPFAFCYDSVIDENKFKKLETEKRDRVILEACVVNSDYADNLSIYNCENVETTMGLKQFTFSTNEDAYVIDNPNKNGILVRVTTDNPYSEKMGYIYSLTEDGHIFSSKIEIPEGKDQSSFEINLDSIVSVSFSGEISKCISDIQIYDISEDYYKWYIEAVSERKKSQLSVRDFDDNSMIGNVTCDSNGVLFASIPFDDRWHIMVDGNEQEVYRVNCGFIGCNITKGSHEVKIYYDIKPWYVSNSFRIVSLIICIALMIGEIIKSKHIRYHSMFGGFYDKCEQ